MAIHLFFSISYSCALCTKMTFGYGHIKKLRESKMDFEAVDYILCSTTALPLAPVLKLDRLLRKYSLVKGQEGLYSSKGKSVHRSRSHKVAEPH